jgi:thiol-disulfide isomerase/thioredoxin
MKKIIYQIIALILIIIINISCDYVKNANPPLDPTSGGGAATNVYISDSTINSDPNLKKVLVEDYTGHKCGNCPEAAVVLTGLEATYGDKIVPLAVHAGFFAATSPVAVYPTDFKTTAGTAYNTQFGFSLYPNGLINRVGYGTAGFIKAYTAWGTEVALLTTQTPKFQLLLKYKYDSGSLKLNTDVKVKSLTNNTGTYKVVILLSEDSIVAEQLDYSIVVTPTVTSQLNPNYVFNHVLRGAINSEWGDAVFTVGGATTNAIETVTKTNFQLNSSYKIPKCHILAYIYDADPASPTYYEVLQVEELKLK